ncbi:MAG: hypothetical protein JSS68_09700 [Actinobacteria bacterium]|nr:hypothetical protein [Actinomycetota bacterium]
MSIKLIGARDEHPVLRVGGDTPAAVRAGWRAFLRRFHDPGRGYLPIFETRATGGA